MEITSKKNTTPKRFVLTQAEARTRVEKGLNRRYRQEYRFKFYGVLSVFFGVMFLGFLFLTIIGNGASAFFQTYVKLEIHFDELVIDPNDMRTHEVLRSANYTRLITDALIEIYPETSGRRDRRALRPVQDDRTRAAQRLRGHRRRGRNGDHHCLFTWPATVHCRVFVASPGVGWSECGECCARGASGYTELRPCGHARHS